MKSTFNDFLEQNSNCKKFEADATALYIYDNILSRDENIIAMINVTEAGEPALSACIKEVEAYFKSIESTSPLFSLLDDFSKQALGRMVKTILEPFAYLPYKQKDMPRGLNTEFVTSAAVYKLTGQPRLKVVQTIIEC